MEQDYSMSGRDFSRAESKVVALGGLAVSLLIDLMINDIGYHIGNNKSKRITR